MPRKSPKTARVPFARSFSQSALPAGGGRQADEDAQPTQEREVLAAVPASHHQTAAMKALGLDIGFLYQKDAAFENRAAELVADRPELSDLVDLMRRDRQEFQKALAWYRNTHLEHRTGDPDSRVASFHRLDSAETMFENVWQAMEDYVAMYVVANLPPALQLEEIPEDERNPIVPKRFRFVLLHVPTVSE